MGPEVFPIIVSVWLIGVGVVLALRTTLVPDWDMAHKTAEEGRATHWPTVFGVAGMLVVYAFTLAPLGYIVATGIFVPACARVLGSRSLLRDIVAGFAVAIVVYLFWTEVLEIRLPTAGILDELLER